jgi:hypothetical protein
LVNDNLILSLPDPEGPEMNHQGRTDEDVTAGGTASYFRPVFIVNTTTVLAEGSKLPGIVTRAPGEAMTYPRS